MGSNAEFMQHQLEEKFDQLQRAYEEQAIELQKRETTINKLIEYIEYARFQKEIDNGMGEHYIQFTMRKVFSILDEALEEVNGEEK